MYTADESGKGFQALHKSEHVMEHIRASIDLRSMDPIQIRRQRAADTIWRSSTFDSRQSCSGSLSSIEELPEGPRSRCSSSQGASQVQTAARMHGLRGTLLRSHRMRGASADAQAGKGAPNCMAKAEMSNSWDPTRSLCSFQSRAKVPASMSHSQLWRPRRLGVYCTKYFPQPLRHHCSLLRGMIHACQIIWERLFCMCPHGRQNCAERHHNSDGTTTGPRRAVVRSLWIQRWQQPACAVT